MESSSIPFIPGPKGSPTKIVEEDESIIKCSRLLRANYSKKTSGALLPFLQVPRTH